MENGKDIKDKVVRMLNILDEEKDSPFYKDYLINMITAEIIGTVYEENLKEDIKC